MSNQSKSFKDKKGKKKIFYPIGKYFINWDSFEESKLVDFYADKNLNPNNFKFFNCRYKYFDNTDYQLLIKTPFIKLINKPFSTGPDNLTIDLDETPNGSQLIRVLSKYDQFAKSQIEKLYGQNFKQVKKIISNNGRGYEEYNPNVETIPVKFYFRYDKDKSIYNNEIINYNVSKKYPKVERFDSIEKKDLERFLRKDKEVRLFISLSTWINKDSSMYGSRANLFKMEVKYENANIKSIIDEDEIELKPRVRNISI